MINNYGFFNKHDENNTLYILFSDEKYNRIVKTGEVDLLCFNNKLVGYRIFDFIRYAKIKYSGIIFATNDLLVVVNSILCNSKLEQLSYKTNSGYFIKKNGNNLGVYAEKGTFLRDETISEGRFCSYFDLYIENENENELIVIDDELLEGKDFFYSKEH